MFVPMLLTLWMEPALPAYQVVSDGLNGGTGVVNVQQLVAIHSPALLEANAKDL